MQIRKQRIRLSSIHHIFISHLHGDHVFGLYGLLSTLSLLGRTSPLHIYAPENYGPILNSHLADFDIHLSFDIVFNPLKTGKPQSLYSDRHLSITSFPLKHRIPTFGFLFSEIKGERKMLKTAIEEYSIPISKIPALKNGADLELPDGTVVPNSKITADPPPVVSYAYCSDTSYFKSLPAFIKEVTVLYHEATFDSGNKALAKKTGHSTTADAANVAREAGAGALLIGHFSSRYKSTVQLEQECREIFPASYAVKEGKTYDLKDLNSF